MLTTEGTVMGTLQYMAPEQFAGKEADARQRHLGLRRRALRNGDGRKAFLGANYQSLVGAILATDPAPMAVKPFTPSWLERLVRQCLEKDPEERYQSMRDVVLELRKPPPQESVSTAAPSKAPRWPWAVAAATLVLGALIGWAFMRSSQVPAPEQAYRFQLLPPEGGQFEAERLRPFARRPDPGLRCHRCRQERTLGPPMDATAARLLPGT